MVISILNCAAKQRRVCRFRSPPATRAMLRDLVRTDPPPTPLLIGILRALGRSRDAAALPIFLRYTLDEHAEVAQAAIEALAACGDSSITPALVRVALSPQAGAATKLNAIEALLRLGDRDAVRLLRPYLSYRSIILQMRAFTYWRRRHRSAGKRNAWRATGSVQRPCVWQR
jgi:hypothetical protein